MFFGELAKCEECTHFVLYLTEWHHDSNYKTQIVKGEGNNYQAHCLSVRYVLVSGIRVENRHDFLAVTNCM
jgi:hypothetical protein